jgi:hypothetical protein
VVTSRDNFFSKYLDKKKKQKWAGKAQFRMPAAGQWVVNVYFSHEVTTKNELKHLADKCTRVVYASTVSFHVKP